MSWQPISRERQETQLSTASKASAIRVIVRPALTASSCQMEHGKQPFWARLELLARLMLNAGKHAGNQPARLVQTKFPHPSKRL
jgi:hypothetical protein